MSFYPPGWDYERVMKCGDEDFNTLTEEQHTTLLNGLKEAGLYQAFADKIHQQVQKELEAERRAEEATKAEQQKLADREIWAPYIHDLDLVFKFESNTWSEWGFVVFRTTPYGEEHDARWAEFRRRWDRILQQEFDQHRGFHPKSDRAMELFTFRWVEDPALAGASPAEVSRHFNEMRGDLPTGLSTTACLMVTPSAMESVIDSPLPASVPLQERTQLPFVVAVAMFMPAEEEVAGGFRGYFNVAVESLLGKFYGIVALDVMDLPRLTASMKDERDIWCSMDGDGVLHYEE
ncbi:hypothetical protein ARAM_003185 [Aspergillus rambellii]|uniref:Uncharacterized protein n=2 Tax=Aspergillus subgen. Nidulantes TaxID=2720870 RepID=A0A0F8V0G3_9EURO|nr:hypothetical protein ARAM_003185 [Aspergillus rambellii]KKK25973.1 hypothetical protein AOCH_000971 [Aspergillus ochraceoroseus]